MDELDDPFAGFCWYDANDRAVGLQELVGEASSLAADMLRAHLESLDQLLIRAAGRLGPVLGGGRAPGGDERVQLATLYRAIDRLSHEYAAARATIGASVEIRAGQIVGAAHLVGMRARMPLGLVAPAPLDGELDEPAPGMVAGYAEMSEVDEARPWTGARWIVRTEDGRRLPARLEMLLRDSSGVDRSLAQDTHRSALRAAVRAAEQGDADARVASGAVDWLLYDWLYAHRDDPASVAVEIAKGRLDDAAIIVEAAHTSIRCRARQDGSLLALPIR